MKTYQLLDDSDKRSGGKTEVFFTTEDGPCDVPRAGMMRPIVISASADSVTSTLSGETYSDDEDFCIIDDPGIGIAVSSNISLCPGVVLWLNLW